MYATLPFVLTVTRAFRQAGRSGCYPPAGAFGRPRGRGGLSLPHTGHGDLLAFSLTRRHRLPLQRFAGRCAAVTLQLSATPQAVDKTDQLNVLLKD